MSKREVFLFLKKYFWQEKWLFIKAMLFILISSLIGVSYGYLIGKGIDFVAEAAFFFGILILLVNLILSVIDSLIFSRLGRIFLSKVVNNMMESLNCDIYEKVGLLPARAFEELKSGNIINRVVDDTKDIANTFSHLIKSIVFLFTSVIVFIYVLCNSVLIALEILAYLYAFYRLSNKYLKNIKDNQKEIRKDQDLVLAEVNESIRGVREIRALGIRENMNDYIKNTFRNIFFRKNKLVVDERNYYEFINILSSLLETVVFITCICLIVLDKGSFAFFMAMTYYLYKLMNTVSEVSNLFTNYQKMSVAMERINEILGNKLYEDIRFGELDEGLNVGKIEFKNVSFKYNDNEKNVLNDLNIVIDGCKTVAIVGKSGEGKSTIFNLLLRYFDTTEGAILLDDIPIEKFTEEAMSKNIAIIRQDPFLFNKSFIDNFKMIDPYVSLEMVREVCKKVYLDDYIMSLSNGYDTLIGEGGTNLSGGQKQRFAIARAILKKSKIILFDEATSALDNENQEKIKRTIDELSSDHTIVMIAHRLTTIVDADKIFVIDKGCVVDSGTHKELLKRCSIYKELYKNEK